MAFDLLEALLETEALRLPPPGEVFWYTSGTVGPYYINTENLYGGPTAAGELLGYIDAESGRADFPLRLRERVDRHSKWAERTWKSLRSWDPAWIRIFIKPRKRTSPNYAGPT